MSGDHFFHDLIEQPIIWQGEEDAQANPPIKPIEAEADTLPAPKSSDVLQPVDDPVIDLPYPVAVDLNETDTDDLEVVVAEADFDDVSDTDDDADSAITDTEVG